MKFTLATSILSQTLPVLAKRTPQQQQQQQPSQHGHNSLQDLAEFLATHKKDQSRKRAGKHALVDFFHAHPLPSAKLVSSSTMAKTPCDPFSSSSSLSKDDGADIGILSCGVGYECVRLEDNTSSSQNSLGGVCMPLLTSRELQTNDQCALCSSIFGMTVGKAFYETVIDDTTSAFVGKTCGVMVSAAYADRTIDAASCPLAAEAVEAAGCCVPTCDLCGRAFEVDYANANLVVDIPLDGYDGITCGSNVPTPNGLVGAAYIYATIDPDNCPIIRQAAIDAGCCVQTLCYTCGFGASTIKDDYDDDTVCADLKVAAYSNRTILEEDCPAAVQLAQEEGCCSSVVPTYGDCNICTSDTTFYPDNWVIKFGTCNFVQSQLNSSECEQLASDLSPLCCSPAPAPFFSIPTSPAPEGDATTPPSSAPLGSTVTPWSLVSIMGLTTAASVGAWMLN